MALRNKHFRYYFLLGECSGANALLIHHFSKKRGIPLVQSFTPENSTHLLVAGQYSLKKSELLTRILNNSNFKFLILLGTCSVVSWESYFLEKSVEVKRVYGTPFDYDSFNEILSEENS